MFRIARYGDHHVKYSGYYFMLKVERADSGLEDIFDSEKGKQFFVNFRAVTMDNTMLLKQESVLRLGKL